MNNNLEFQNEDPSPDSIEDNHPRTNYGQGYYEEPKQYPIGGYAPGYYSCTCVTCKKEFTGDKRAVQCEPCAIEMVSIKIVKNNDSYQIEESKQETLTYTEAAKKEERIFNSTMMSNQETLEEAAERYAHNYFNMHETNNYKALKQGYEAGAKEMAERMYSEEEVKEALLQMRKTPMTFVPDKRMYSEEQLFKILLDFVEFPHDHNEGRGSIINRFLKELKKK
jgi:hypothetical protein